MLIRRDSLRLGGVLTGAEWPQSEWQRLALALREQRVRALKFASKAELYRAREVPAGLQRIISDLENAVARNYDDDTVIRVETLYGWGPGSIRRVLNGEPPTGEVAVTSDLPTQRTSSVELRVRLKALIDALPDTHLERVRRYLTKMLTEQK